MTDQARAIESAPHHPRPPEKVGLRMDLTVNIPTIITLVTMLTGIVSFGVSKYSELTEADQTATTHISALRNDVDKLAAAQSGVVKEMRDGLDAIRKENRDDFKEVRGTLERINDRLVTPPNNSNMKGWTR